MSISIGATSEHVLRGIDRMIAAVVDLLPLTRVRTPAVPRAWLADRGAVIATTNVAVSGGFPGSSRALHHISRAALTLTASWLIVGEGTTTGFALPLTRVVGCAVLPCAGMQPPCLVLWYRDGATTGSFLVRFAGTTRNRHGELRAHALQQQLISLGVPFIATEDAAFVPDLHCPWSEIDTIADGDIRFTGMAQASVGGPFGSVFDTARVWITDNWLLWCPTHGNGLNRLSLDRIVESRSGYGDRLAIGMEDACGGRYDLHFDFGITADRSKPATQVQQVLAAAGVPVGVASAVIAPWRRGGTQRPVDV